MHEGSREKVPGEEVTRETKIAKCPVVCNRKAEASPSRGRSEEF